jgi:RNA polymerase sigma-70 factor (ECF subfamily)
MGGPGTVVESPERADAARAAGEARLAHQAVAGDGAAFAALYDRYELAVFNVCARVLDSPDEAAIATQRAFLDALERWSAASDGDLDLDLDLGLVAAAHAVCTGVAEHEHAEANGDADAPASESTPERYVDPERAEQLSSLQDDVRRANQRLSEPHREVLALRDLEGLAYDQIAAATGTKREFVIDSLARARVSLRDALRDSSLAQDAAKALECKRALVLLAMRVDGQLDGRAEREWLDGHLGSCETCRASLDAMQEARIAYRAWLPLLPPPWRRTDTLAEAAQHGGQDVVDQPAGPWELPPDNGAVTAARGIGAAAAPPQAAELAPGEATSPLAVAVATSRGARERGRRRRRWGALAIVIPIVLLAGAAAAVLAGGGSGGKKRAAGTAASRAPVARAKAATPVPQAQTRQRKRSKRTSVGSSSLALRAARTQPTTPQLTPSTTSDPAPASRTPRRTTPQQPQSIGGGNEHRTPRQPAPSRPTPAPTSPTSTAPTGTLGSSGASSP